MEFTRLSEDLAYRAHLFEVFTARISGPDGHTFERDIVRHPGAVGIVPIDGDDVVLVRQYRPALDRPLLELPAGTRDKAGEPPATTAARELAEEIGAVAAVIEPLVTYVVAPGFSDEEMHLFVARGLTFGSRAADGPEEDAMTIERVRLAEAAELILRGEIVDAKTIVGLLLVLAAG